MDTNKLLLKEEVFQIVGCAGLLSAGNLPAAGSQASRLFDSSGTGRFADVLRPGRPRSGQVFSFVVTF